MEQKEQMEIVQKKFNEFSQKYKNKILNESDISLIAYRFEKFCFNITDLGKERIKKFIINGACKKFCVN